MLIASNPGLKQTELASVMGIARSGVLAIVEALGLQGLIERRPAPGDARAQALFLSPLGEEKLPQIVELVREHDRELVRGFSAAEIETLKSLLERIQT